MKNNEKSIFNIDENGVLTGLCGVLNIPEGVTKIAHNYSFGVATECDFITEVNIPASCEEVEGDFIQNYNNVLRFCVSSENKNLISENGVIYTLGKKKLIKYPAGMVCDIFCVPAEVEEIGEYAFAHAKHVSGVYIGKNCRSIKKNAFHQTTHTVLGKNEYGAITEDCCEYLGIRKYYISPSVQDLAHDIFDGDWCEDGVFYENVIVGGEIGSAIWEYCNKCDIKFLEVKEEDAEAFLATPFAELQALHKATGDFPVLFDFTEEGFGGKLEGDTLELFVLDKSRKDVTVCKLDARLPQSRCEKIKKLIIGDGICSFVKDAFWNYYDLECVSFGADVSAIKASAFYDDYKISTLAVDDRNEHYKCIDGVIFSSDLKTLVLYPSGREDAYYEIPSHVEIVGEQCMLCASLRCIKFGSNVKKICSMACYNTYRQHHIYVDPAVSEFEDDFIFGVTGKLNVMCTCTWKLVVGGKAGSPIEKYCRETGRDGITFEVVEDDQLKEWLTPPLDDIQNPVNEVDLTDSFHF